MVVHVIQGSSLFYVHKINKKKKQYRKQQKKQNNTMHNAAIFIKQRLQNCWVSLYNMLFMLFNIPLHVAFIPSPLVTLY